MVCLSNIQLLLFFAFFSPCPISFLFSPSDLPWDKVTFWNACSRFDLSTEQAIYGKGTWHGQPGSGLAEDAWDFPVKPFHCVASALGDDAV